MTIARMRILLLIILVVSGAFIPMPSPAGENERLPSNPRHRESHWYKLVETDHANVFDVMDAVRRDTTARAAHASKEWRTAMRWIAERLPHATANGTIGPRTPRWDDVERVIRDRAQKRPDQPLAEPRWRPIGPFGWDTAAVSATGSMGIGVIRTHCVDRTDRRLILVGTISSGIWRSTDAGETWTNVALEHPIQSVRRIVMSGSNVYAATDAGLYESRDRGQTFRRITLRGDDALINAVGVDQVVVAPTDDRRIVIATLNRLFVSVNGGQTFSSASNFQGTWWDLQWHPTRNDLAFALVQRGGHITFVRSTSAGVKFDSVGTGYPERSATRTMARAAIGLSARDPKFVSVLIGGSIRDSVGGVYGLYVSRDEGSTFEHRCCGAVDGPEPANATTNKNLFDYEITGNGLGQITWDMAFAVGDRDTSLMLAAGIFPYVSYDGGRSWNSMPPMHYDIQSASIHGDTIWLTHDGGITESRDRGRTIRDRSRGISASEIWGFDQSHDGSIQTLGAYHLPIFIKDTTVYDPSRLVDGWYAWSGADAMGANVNPIATEWIYAKPWANVRALRTRTNRVPPRASDLGIDLGYITLTNVCVDPHRYRTIVACDHGEQRVVISKDNANTWQTLLDVPNWVSRVRMFAEDGRYLLVLAEGKLMRSVDQGRTWVDITPPTSITRGQGMVDMAFVGGSPDRLALVFGSNQSEVKVVRSDDGGRTWVDRSAGLPSFAIKTIIARRGGDAELYVGTSFGVYRSVGDTDWEAYGTDLPITDVNFLHCDEVNGILRAATMRGLWEIPVARPARPLAMISRDVDTVTCHRIPVRFGCRSLAREDVGFTRTWIFEGGEPATSSARTVDVRYTAPGRYDVTLIVSDGVHADTMTEVDAVTVVPSECGGIDRTAGKSADLTQPQDNVTLGRLVGDGSAFSFTAWVYPVGMQPNFSAILCTDADPGVEGEIGMQFVNDRNEIGYLWKNGRWWWNSGLSLRPNEWSHVALTVDTSGATVYVNGKPSTDATRLPAQNLAALIMKLGTYHNWSTRNFNGYIDEVAFYGRKLDVDEVRRGMHLTKRRDDPGLLAYYQFNESGGGRVYDKIFGRDGELEAGASRSPSGAIVGDGVSDLVVIDDTTMSASFTAVGDALTIANATIGSTVLLTRLDIDATSPPSSVATIRDRWWVVDVFATDGRVAEVLRADHDASRLFTAEEGATRRFAARTRAEWRTDTSWTGVRNAGAATYDAAQRTLTQRFVRGTTIPHQWVMTVEGGTVSVADEQRRPPISVWPQPASDLLTCNDVVEGHTLRIIDLWGKERLREQADGRGFTTLDVRALETGTYILASGDQRLSFVILR